MRAMGEHIPSCIALLMGSLPAGNHFELIWSSFMSWFFNSSPAIRKPISKKKWWVQVPNH